MPVTRELIINADDLGEQKFNAVIGDGLYDGTVTSATVLVGRDGAAEALANARDNGHPVGLHFNLTQGPTVADPGDIPSLVDENGLFLGKERFESRLAVGQVDPRDIDTECVAQLRSFEELRGESPTHVDGHHHVHARPVVASVVGPVLARRGVPRVRVPIEDHRHLAHLEPDRRAWAIDLVADAHRSARTYASHGLRWPDFMGIGYGWQHCTMDRVARRIRELPVGKTEYMVHVARETDFPASDPAFLRHLEWDLLRSQDFRDLLRDERVSLISYADL